MSARSEFISRLKDMPEEYSKVAIRAFDFIEHNYELNKKETALSTVVEQMQREVALYRDCKTVEGCSKAAIKNRLLLINSLLTATGKPVREITANDVRDLDLQQNVAPVLGKGKKVRTVYINAKAKVALADYLKTRKDNCEYLFISERKVNGMTVVATPKVLQARIAEINKRANIGKHITPHVLRHTTATIALQNGMPLEDIQVMLGHASCSTTLLYADVCDTKVRREHERCVI